MLVTCQISLFGFFGHSVNDPFVNSTLIMDMESRERRVATRQLPSSSQPTTASAIISHPLISSVFRITSADYLSVNRKEQHIAELIEEGVSSLHISFFIVLTFSLTKKVESGWV